MGRRGRGVFCRGTGALIAPRSREKRELPEARLKNDRVHLTALSYVLQPWIEVTNPLTEVEVCARSTGRFISRTSKK
jgi:hypothetical protein